MTLVQKKLLYAGGALLLAWLLMPRKKDDPKRVSREVEIEADIYNKNFGLTQEEIDARAANPANDPRMRDLIDVSNAVIAADNLENP